MKKFDLFEKVFGSLFKIDRSFIINMKFVTDAMITCSRIGVTANGVYIDRVVGDDAYVVVNFSAKNKEWEIVKDWLKKSIELGNQVYVKVGRHNNSRYEEL